VVEENGGGAVQVPIKRGPASVIVRVQWARGGGDGTR
jgi:hypothetical protein